MRLDTYLNEAPRVTLKAGVKGKINKELSKLETYQKAIPLDKIFKILNKQGVIVLMEDGTPWDGMLLGRTGQEYFDIAPKDSEYLVNKLKTYTPYTNAKLSLSWYKMDSGNYEIISYVG